MTILQISMPCACFGIGLDGGVRGVEFVSSSCLVVSICFTYYTSCTHASHDVLQVPTTWRVSATPPKGIVRMALVSYSRWDGENPRTPNLSDGRRTDWRRRSEHKTFSNAPTIAPPGTQRMGSIAEGKIEDPSPAASGGLLDGLVLAPVPLLRLTAGLSPVYGCMH